MPRPKRTKVAPSAPAPRSRKPTKRTVEPTSAAPPPPRAFDDLYDVSDPEDRIVANTRQGQKSTGNQGAKAAGATDLDDAPEEANAGLAAQSVDDMLENFDQDSSSPAIETGRRERATPGLESSILAISKFKRRPRQQSILGRGPSRARSSSIESELAEDNGLTGFGRGRRDNSTLGGDNVKRKAREQSVSGQNAAPPASMALQMGTPAHVGSAMKIANFKRRAREPSILGTARKPQAQYLQYDDEDEDDFNPEDESTPLNLSKNKNMSSSSAPSSSNPRKRKLSTVQVPQSSPTLPSPRAISPDEAIPSTEQEVAEDQMESELDEAEPDDLPIPSIERPHTPEILSDTMAPPRSSSSSLPSPEMPSRMRRAPSRGRRTLRNRTPPPQTQDSPISSPPSLTHSPNRPPLKIAKPKPKNAAPPPSTLSTAQLQALLPRRRRRQARDTFSIPSSEEEVDVSNLASEDDELSHISVRPRSRRGNALNRTPSLPSKKPAKGKQVPKGKEPITKRTYGSRQKPNLTSDKENNAEIEVDVDVDDSLGPIPDDEGGARESENSQEMEMRIGKELKQAARKFKEVDKWELEFEEITASSSSPRDAR
jgi:hypothetical protein